MKIISSISYYLLSFKENFELKSIVWFFAAFIPLATQVLFWEITPWLIALLVVYCIDFVLWIWIALSKWTFDIERFMRWIYKFILFWVAIIVWNEIDNALSDFVSVIDLHSFHFFLAKFWIIWYIFVHEAISALGKLYSIGVPIPKGLIDKLLGYKKTLNEDTNFTTNETWTTLHSSENETEKK